jgi:hypothetical protein
MISTNIIIASVFISDNPKLETGVTELCYSDRHAYTIIEIRDPKHITVQRDKATRIDKNGMSESQQYEFTPDPQGRCVDLSLRKNGNWLQVGMRKGSNVFMIGRREEYYDYSF